MLAPDGSEAWRAGGAWHRTGGFFDSTVTVANPRVVTLTRAQWWQPDGTPGAGQGYAARRRARQAGQRVKRAFLTFGGRGSGKTYLCGGIIGWTEALDHPGDFTFCIAVQGKAKREVQEALQEIAGDGWLTGGSESPTDPITETLFGHTFLWHTGTRPKSFRFAGIPIRHVLLNEGQAQSVEAAVNAVAATRNVGGIFTIAANPPQKQAGDWLARLYYASRDDEEEISVEAYNLRTEDNDRIDQAAADDIGGIIQVIDETAYRADVLGEMAVSGDLAFPGFKPIPLSRGGNLGDPPDIGWEDVTRELTSRYAPSQGGFQYVGGCDFQGNPGCCAAIGKIYRRPDGLLVLAILETVGSEGEEEDLSQALLAAGYTRREERERPGVSLMLIGDATGARQDAKHKTDNYSFARMRTAGWVIDSPDRHRRTGVEWWAPRKESRKQTNGLFRDGRILVSTRCKERPGPFKSLVDCLSNVKLTSTGEFHKAGHWTHLPDGVRYLAWRFMERPMPPKAKPMRKADFDATAGIKLTST